jgi:dTDP-N-acetylfucosamine:lipid II N-acetylfucosaminyltransferase
MNLHVSNDEYGLYPSEIARRIQASGYADNNLMVNLSVVSQFRHEKIIYIPVSSLSFKRFINGLNSLEKIIFHPYNLSGFHFLTYVLKKFPHVKVYWVCWSYELYKQPQVAQRLYEPYSAAFLKKNTSFKDSLQTMVKKTVLGVMHFTGMRQNYFKNLLASYSRIDYFCSLLYSDFSFFLSVASKKDVKYLEFSYLSLNNILPDLDSFTVCGNEIMIGHSALPDGNHYEIMHRLAEIDPKFPVFLPLVYGNKNYRDAIKKEAFSLFQNVSVQEEKLDSTAYHQRLANVGWAIINSKVQQGLGNILALLCIGAKLFLDENTSTYKDFKQWGISVYTVQHDLTKEQLSQKLTVLEMENNRDIILKRFNEEKVSSYWEPLLN